MVSERILRNTVLAYFKVEVRSGSAACVANLGDERSFLHSLARSRENLGAMSVQRGVRVLMRKYNKFADIFSFSRQEDRAGSCGGDVGTWTCR